MATAILDAPLTPPRWLTVPQVATYLAVQNKTAYHLVKSPGFPRTPIGRLIKIREDLFLRWVERYWQEVQPPEERRTP